MKLYLQWALRTARDWQLSDSSEWSNLPRKADPVRSSPIPDNQLDNNPGWLAALNVQGVEFGYDHTVVTNLTDGSGGIVVTIWNDNPTTSPPGKRVAQGWTVLPLAPDSKFGGALNTRQSRVVYAEDQTLYSPNENTVVRPWSEFVVPAAAPVHGIWVTDAKWAQHLAARTERGFRDWIA